MDESIRIGTGFDIHQWTEGRPCILGGVEIPYEKGLLGHSDADALTHAIIDALLGALCLGDIGQHFPDTDPNYKGADSIDLLKRIMILVQDKGFRVGNVDATIVTDHPKMAPHLLKMRRTLAKPLLIKDTDISLKATRTEGVIQAGQEGLIAMVSLLLFRNP